MVNALIPSHYGQQVVNLALKLRRTKYDKNFWETIRIWLALNCFSRYVNKGGQQNEEEGEPLFVLPPGGKIWKVEREER